jgi:ketosteroid isomerase-like protein
MGTSTAIRSNVDLLEQLYGAFARGDIPTVLAAMDPQIEWTSAEGSPYRGTFIGPDAVLTNIFARMGSEWDDFRVEPTEHLDAGDNVVTLGRYSGTYKATGRGMNAAFAHVWTLRDGRITRYRQYVDTLKVAEAL